MFDTQFDALVVTRGTGAASTKMNWINANFTAYNSVPPPVYQQDIGYYTSEAIGGRLYTSYTPSINTVLFTLNDACWGFKVGGSFTTNGVIGGWFSSGGTMSWWSGVGSYVRLNSHNDTACPGNPYIIGYNMLSRTAVNSLDEIRNATKTNYNYLAGGLLPTGQISMLTWNIEGYFPAVDEKLELYYFGKSMTQTQFNTFQTIFDTYFAAF